MRNHKNLVAKIILFVILFLGVIFELANHFHLTYIFVDSKLGTLIPAKWVLIISFLGAMFFVASIVGLGVIGYRGLSWFMALLTIGVSYMSYALIPASINTDTMQMATLEYALVLPLIVAFTTHELSKFLGLKEITTLTQEQEIELEKIKRNQEFEQRKKQLTISQNASVQNTQNSNASVPNTQNTPDPYHEAFEKFGINGTPLPHKNGNGKYQNASVPKNDIGFKFQNASVPIDTEIEVINEENPQNVSVLSVLKEVHVGEEIGCEVCDARFIKKRIDHRFCSDACRLKAHKEKGGKE